MFSPGHRAPSSSWIQNGIVVFLVALTSTLVACSDDEPTPPPVDNPPTITLTKPVGGVAIAPGAVLDIEWTASDDNQVVGVDLSWVADGGQMGTIATGRTGNSHQWTVPNSNLYGIRIKAVARDNAGQTAEALNPAIFAVVPVSARGYVTSKVCADCHTANAAELAKSGHPYKLNKVTGGNAPTLPFTTVPGPPVGYTWSDITYLIGGYAYKARFMDKDGFILVTGVTGKQTQYNMPRTDLGFAGGWGNYESTTTAPKPYTCGSCHTTGWQTTAENGGVNQDGLAGILGTWEETGITCEQCHGAGGVHVATKNKAQIGINRTKEACGSCHFRDTNHRILASGGFIRHHEQYDELIGGAHVAQSCTNCHDPHIGTKFGNAANGGIKVTCESCHRDVTTNRHLVPATCVSCHMARAGKSAINMHDFEGDVRTHLFRIHSEPVGKSAMFFNDGGVTYSKGFVTLDFACYSCHKDPVSGKGGTASAKSLADLSAKAKGIHN